jgi:tetratricopeptide (TPR) repeat protein
VLKDAVDEARNGVSVRTRGLLRLGIARFRLSRENLDGALRDALEARKDFQEAADKKGIADSDHVAGLVYEMKGDRAKALALLQKALELYIAMGIRLAKAEAGQP